jgi:hypothetical protein
MTSHIQWLFKFGMTVAWVCLLLSGCGGGGGGGTTVSQPVSAESSTVIDTAAMVTPVAQLPEVKPPVEPVPNTPPIVPTIPVLPVVDRAKAPALGALLNEPQCAENYSFSQLAISS